MLCPISGKEDFLCQACKFYVLGSGGVGGEYNCELKSLRPALNLLSRQLDSIKEVLDKLFEERR